jgi:putative pyruvate formate lyase activating enzyme
MFRLFPPDTEAVWKNLIILERFSHYHGVQRGLKTAKYLIVKKTPVSDLNIQDLPLSELWKIHKSARSKFSELNRKIEQKELAFEDIEAPLFSFMDLKVLISKKILQECHFCERRCGLNRTKRELGFCRLADKSIVTSAFLHIGEEPPLIPSGTIFFTSCTFNCVFCQNWTISQEWGDIDNIWEGRFVNPITLSKIMNKIYEEGAKNINWVGGDPTPNIHTIIESLTHFQANVIHLWNSNMYTSSEGMDLLLDIMDFWLPDLKFHDNVFAKEMTKAKNYWEIATRNIKSAYDQSSSEMIIRHLVMPERLEADTFPILDWCAEYVPLAFVNIMGQYHPEHKIHGDPQYNSLTRRVTPQEMDKARKYADKLGIHWREV